MRTIFFWRREKNGEIFNVKMFGKMKKHMARMDFSPLNGRRASELIFDVKMFGKFFEIQPSSAFSNFLSGPLI